MADIEAAILARLTGSNGLTTDTNLFRGFERGSDAAGSVYPTNAVFVTATGGVPHVPFADGSGTSNKELTAQILIRWQVDEYATGRSKAQSIFDRIHNSDLSGSISGAGYCLAISGAPIPLGPDNRGCYKWSINVRIGLIE